MPEAWAPFRILTGTLANRPVPGIADRYYWATDVLELYRDTGVLWQVVSAFHNKIHNSNGHVWEPNAANLQAAIDDLPAEGGWVEGPGSRTQITISTPITVPSHVKLMKVKLYLADGSDCDMIINSDPVGGNVGIIVENCILDGNGTNQTAASRGIYFNNVGTATVEGAIIENCTVRNCYHAGIHLHHSENCKVIHNTAINNGDGANQHGIKLEVTGFTVVADNICIVNKNHGISIEDGSHYNTVEGNICRGNPQGIVIELGWSSHNDVVGNVLQNNGNGILLTVSTRYNNIVGNVITLGTDYGIAFSSGAHHNNIVGNFITSNSQTITNTDDNISLRNEADYNFICGNFLRAGPEAKVPRYAINIETADCDGNVVINNDLYDDGYGTGVINDAGTDTIINNNRGNVGFYQEQATAAWTNPTGTATNGTRVLVYNSHANQAAAPYRVYNYMNGAWRPEPAYA